MMRKSLLFLMIVLIAMPSVFAARKKDKAGVVKDYVYTDKKHNISLQLNESWKYKIQKNKSNFRLVLTQIKYAIPPEYVEAPDYTKIPKVVMIVVDTKLSPKTFIDSLLSSTYKSKSKKIVMKECEILSMTKSTGFVPEKLISRKKKILKLDDMSGYFWTGQMKYTNEVSVSASSRGGKRVKGGFGAAMATFKKGDKIVIFHVICEWNYFDSVFEEAMKIIKTIKWN